MVATIKRRRPAPAQAAEAPKDEPKAEPVAEPDTPAPLAARIKEKAQKAQAQKPKAKRKMLTVSNQVHARLAALSKDTGITMSKLVGHLLDEAERR